MLNTKPQKRNNVTIDDRRAVIVVARNRKPADVAKVPHEAFIRNALKDRLNWPRRDPAPEQLKQIARELAAQLVARDKELAKAAAEAKAANEKKEA